MIEAGIQPMKTFGSKSVGDGTARPPARPTATASSKPAGGASMTSTVVSETVVITGMALTTLALGTGLYLQAGVDAMGAMLIALGGYAAMLLMHAFVRQSAAPGRRSRRQRADHADSFEVGTGAGAVSGSAEFGSAVDDDEPTRSLFAEYEDETAPADLPSNGSRGETELPARSENAQSDAKHHRLPEGTGDPFGTLRPKSGPSFDAAPAPSFGPAAASDDVVTQPVIMTPVAKSASRPAGSGRADDLGTRSGPSLEIGIPDNAPKAGVSIVSGPPREADVEMIQSLIKKLADEVNAASTTGHARDNAGNPAMGDNSAGSERGISREDEPAFDAQGAIEQSVGALRSTAGTMRWRQSASGADTQPETRGQVIGRAHSAVPADRDGWREDRDAEEHELAHGSELATGPAREFAAEPTSDVTSGPAVGSFDDARGELVHARLNAITEAIESGRVDVLLDPILGISDGKARHFEVAVRLRDRDENSIDLSEGLEDVANTGVLPLLDRARLSRTSQLALRLESRGRSGALFSQFTGESLITDQFLDEFADAYRERESFAGQLVMTFSQADIRRLGPREWLTLVDMADLGFRFAVSGVCDLDMDFEDLRSRGFQFVKLDADVFLNGLPAAEVTIPAGDICKHLSGVGMTLIVGEIADEQVAAKVFGFGVLFGQGSLFGGPRLVKQTAVSSDRDSSAAA